MELSIQPIRLCKSLTKITGRNRRVNNHQNNLHHTIPSEKLNL